LSSIFKNGASLQKFPNAYVFTGSIASGKSTAINLLKERGFSVIDADLIAHEQLEICKCEIVEAFGEQILDEAGKIDRKKLGDTVFNEPKKLKNLEQILHPKIKEEILSCAVKLECLGQVYFVDIPLFFEKEDRYDEFKNVAVIYAPKELLLSRLMNRNGLKLEEAKVRVELQMDIEQKRKKANFIIDNSGDKENLEKETGDEEEENIFKKLLSLLYNITYGDDRFLFNGHSNFKSESRITCIDTSATQVFTDKLKATQYFNILTWSWQIMSRDRTEKVLLVCDEAYLMVDERTPQSLIYLRNFEKRSRKYEASIAIISHSVVDFLSPEVKKYGQALLDIPTYKFIFGTDGRNLAETTTLYKLTKAEEELLLSKKRGNALFICGSKKMKISFSLTPEELSLFGKAGGR